MGLKAPVREPPCSPGGGYKQYEPKATAAGRPTVERKPECTAVSPRTETAYKANELGQVAPHTETPGSGSGGKAKGVPRECACFAGETSIPSAPAMGRGSTAAPRPATPTPSGRVEGVEASAGTALLLATVEALAPPTTHPAPMGLSRDAVQLATRRRTGIGARRATVSCHAP
jgi:hypothetical protein